MKGGWVNVCKKMPCGICGKPDWCIYNPQSGNWVCMRVESPRPTEKGWWHRGGEKPQFVPKPEPEPPQIDAGRMMLDFRNGTRPGMLDLFAHSLGVSSDSLRSIGCAWAKKHYAWAFPMKNGRGHTIGIRLRLRDGRKLSVKGGHEGVFLPHGRSTIAYLVEGPTDLAAALTLGLWGIGRPSCRGGVAHTQVTINRLGIQRVIIIGDNDPQKWNDKLQRWDKSPGIEGAKSLAAELQVPVASMLLPTKDLREYVRMGGTLPLLKSLERQLVWRQPR
jgi:hypothetical protein